MTTEANEAPMPPPAPAAPVRRSPRRWVVVTLGMLAVAALAVPVWRLIVPPPELEPALRAVSAERWEEAESRLKRYIAYDPGNALARIRLAYVLLSVDPPRPEEALRQLSSLKTDNRSLMAEAHTLRGQALRAQGHAGAAEREWIEARKLDPQVAEAGWRLLDLYYSEGRNDELRRLALRLHRIEPDPSDRVRLLLEAMRPDAEPLASAGVIPMFKDTVKSDPEDRYAALAYYRALAKDGTGVEEAIAGLRRLVAAHPDDPALADGLLFALLTDGLLEEAGKVLAALPAPIAKDRRFARYRGQIAEANRDHEAAVREYRTALEEDPSDQAVLHRLGEQYKLAGKPAEADAIKAREADVEAARVELRAIKGREQVEGEPGLFEQALTFPGLGVRPSPDLYKRLGSVRERMGHRDEALAWYRLARMDAPDDPEVREAIARLDVRGSDPGAKRPAPAPADSSREDGGDRPTIKP